MQTSKLVVSQRNPKGRDDFYVVSIEGDVSISLNLTRTDVRVGDSISFDEIRQYITDHADVNVISV